MQRKKVLFVVGSPNQTTQMHQIANLMEDYDCYFSQAFDSNPAVKMAVKSGFLNKTIMAGGFKRKADEYLKTHNLQNDYAASSRNKYDMAVVCTDLVFPKSFEKIKTVWVQEGMTDPLNTWSKIVKRLKLPAYLTASTSLNGTSNVCDIYCAASEGYKEHFIKLGTDASRILVTGIPNYDNIHSFLTNNFPYKNYVLVATSDIREVWGKDDREKFIGEVVQIAAGRKIIFKLHPNEKKERAIAEIRKYAPYDTLVYTDGNVNEMIANCDELITQYSTVVYVGIVLGKKVHSYFDLNELKKLTPVQNGGSSAQIIADICRSYIEFNGTRDEFLADHESTDSQSVKPGFKKQKNIVTIIQTRTGSTRLPGKTLRPLLGKPLFIRQYERVCASNLCGTVVIATTKEQEDDMIEQLCRAENIECYRGDAEDLLDRHYQAALKYKADAVVKIPSDCPLIDPKIIDLVISDFLNQKGQQDYVSNLHPASFPDGNDVEIMTLQCLEDAWKNAKKKFEHEHTTPYIWEHPEQFSIGNVTMPGGEDLSMSHRWTIDYEEDYQFIKRVYEELYAYNPLFTMEDILNLLERKKDIYNINSRYAGVNWYRKHLDELQTITPQQTKILTDEL